jgi:diacylglycerol kinase family enzyme
VSAPRHPAARNDASTRLAALVALLAALVAAIVLVATVFRSPVAVAVAVAALVVAGGCSWIALTRSGLVRLLALAATLVAIAVSLTALFMGGAHRGVIAFAAALALFTVAARGARGRRIKSRARPRQVSAAEPRKDARAVLLMNPWSGGGKVERFALAEEAKKRGIETITLQRGDDLRQLALDAVKTATVIGMAGGDGSQALVAEVAMRHDVPYVCIPAGTRNHLALDLGLDRDDVVAALAGFTDGVERRIDMALVNDRVFVNNVSLGVYAEIVRSDAYRDAKLATMERMLPDLLGPGAKPMDLRYTDGAGKAHETAQLLMVSNNPYRLDHLIGVGSRPRMDTGVLGILAVEIKSAAQAAALYALETVGRARDFGGWLEWSAPAFTVDSDAPIAAGIDGESISLPPPLRFELVPQALTVLLPPTAIGLSPAALSPTLSRAGVKELWSDVRPGDDAP